MVNQTQPGASQRLWFGWVMANTVGGAIGLAPVLAEFENTPGSEAGIFMAWTSGRIYAESYGFDLSENLEPTI